MLAPSPYVRLCHPEQESHGCCPCQLGGSAAGRQTSLALPPALWRGGEGRTMCWRIVNNAGQWGEHRTLEAGTFGSRVSTRNLPEMGQMQECN